MMTTQKTQENQRSWAVPVGYSTTGGRERGRQLRDAALAEIEACPADGVLVIDFSSVTTLDFSAADEVVGGLIARVVGGSLGTRRFVLTGLGESAHGSIEAVLQLRKRQCLEMRANGQVRVLGLMSSAHQETLQYVMERGDVAVADVAEKFWSTPNMTAATNRLNTLAALGLVMRRQDRGPRGNRYVYRSLLPSGQGDTPKKGNQSP